MRVRAQVVHGVLFWAWAAGVADADPVRVTYAIQVVDRVSLISLEAEPFSAELVLHMSFDSGVTLSGSEAGFVYKRYGTPSFSDVVGLPGPSPPTDFQRQGGYTQDSWSYSQHDQLYVWQGVASYAKVGEQLAGDELAEYVESISIENVRVFLTKPELTPLSFANFLGTGPQDFRSFYYTHSYYFYLSGYTEDSYTYRGYPTLVEAAPVPEPATMSLFALGATVVGIARRRITRSRNVNARLMSGSCSS